jgi:hypothetical protein
MNAYGGVDATLALTSAPDGSKRLASRFGRFTVGNMLSLESVCM